MTNRTITLLFLLIAALFFTAGRGTAQDKVLPGRTLFVTVESTKEDFVKGLQADHFKIFENKVEQKISSFTPGGAPVSIGVLFDVSDSMQDIFPRDIEDAAARISGALRAQPAGNDYFLMAYNKRVALLADWTTDPESIDAGLKNRETLRGKDQGVSTVLYDACFQAVQKLSAGKHEKKALIIVTDGVDASSKPLKKEVIDLARDGNIQVYTLIIKKASTVDTNPPPFEPPYKIPIAEFLTDITDNTGGAAHMVSSIMPGNLDRDLKTGKLTPFQRKIEMVFAALRSQYTIRYSPESTGGGNGLRTVDVKLALTPEIKKGKGVISLRFREKFRPGD